jgi:hypothetical protein
VRWVHVVGGPGWDQIGGLALDPTVGVVVAGQIENTVDVGCGPLPGQYRDALLAALTPADGRCRWSRNFGGPDDESADALAVDGAGGLHVAGHFRSPMFDLGGGALPKFASNWDEAWAARFTATASGATWAWSDGFLGQGDGIALALGPGPSLALTGYFYEDLQVNGASVTQCCPQGNGMFAVDLAGASGAAPWAAGARVVDPNSIDRVQGQSVAVSGGVVFVGGFVDGPGPVAFGATNVNPIGHTDAFLAGYDATTGALRWVKTWGAPNDFASGDRLLAESGGTVLFAGAAPEGADLGTGPLAGYGAHAFVMRVDGAGNVKASFAAAVEYGGMRALAPRPDGRLAVVGEYRGTVTLGGATFTSEPLGDPFVGVLSSDLTTLSDVEVLSTNGDDFLRDEVVVGPDGTTYLGINFVDWCDLRGHRYPGSGGWDFLVAALP